MIDKLDKIKIAIIGLGYVGLPLAVEFGKKFQVIELKNPTPIRRAGILRRKGASTNRICTDFIDTLKSID